MSPEQYHLRIPRAPQLLFPAQHASSELGVHPPFESPQIPTRPPPSSHLREPSTIDGNTQGGNDEGHDHRPHDGVVCGECASDQRSNGGRAEGPDLKSVTQSYDDLRPKSFVLLEHDRDGAWPSISNRRHKNHPRIHEAETTHVIHTRVREKDVNRAAAYIPAPAMDPGALPEHDTTVLKY